MSSVTAVIQAGGAGSRMRSSGIDVPKPLVEVNGISLLERNITSLARAGFTDIALVVPAPRGQDDAERSMHPIEIAAIERCTPLASSLGAQLRVVVETVPRGNMGAVGMAVDDPDATLVVFADNLTDLDLVALVDRHQRVGAELTLAVHDEEFRDPYGVPIIEGDTVIGYDEKPTRRARISSGYCVLGPAAVELLRGTEPIGLVDLCRRLIDAQLTVRPFLHDAKWVDVNDAVALEKAKALFP